MNQKEQDVSARSHRGSQDLAVPILALLPRGGLRKSLSGEFRVQEGVLSPPKWGAGAEIPQLPDLHLYVMMCACKKSTP